MVRSMVRDRFINDALGRAPSCGRLYDERGDRDGATQGRDSSGKKRQP
jgi:hypothetical protein